MMPRLPSPKREIPLYAAAFVGCGMSFLILVGLTKWAFPRLPLWSEYLEQLYPLIVLFLIAAGLESPSPVSTYERPSKSTLALGGVSAWISGLISGLLGHTFLFMVFVAESMKWLLSNQAGSQAAQSYLEATDALLIMPIMVSVLLGVANIQVRKILRAIEAKKQLREGRLDTWARTAWKQGMFDSEGSIAGIGHLRDGRYGALALEPAWRHMPVPVAIRLLSRVRLQSSESEKHRFAGYRVATEVLHYLSTVNSPSDARLVSKAASNCLSDLSHSPLKAESVKTILLLINRTATRLLPYSGSGTGRKAAQEMLVAFQSFARGMSSNFEDRDNEKVHGALQDWDSTEVERLAMTVDVDWTV